MMGSLRSIAHAHTWSLKAIVMCSCEHPLSVSSFNPRRPSLTIYQDANRPHALKPPHLYSFDRVFPPSTSQSVFFTTTTLPLVEKLLHGENGLLFAYGVTNSGKTYTISGGNSSGAEDRGVLPRAMDVVFNSIAGLETEANVSCGVSIMADLRHTVGMRWLGGRELRRCRRWLNRNV